MTIWQEILEMLKQGWQAFVDSGLAQKGALMLNSIITFDTEEVIAYLWDIYNTLFPNGGVM